MAVDSFPKLGPICFASLFASSICFSGNHGTSGTDHHGSPRRVWLVPRVHGGSFACVHVSDGMSGAAGKLGAALMPQSSQILKGRIFIPSGKRTNITDGKIMEN